MPAVLFVCAANRCRSPLAAALFRRRLAKAGHEGALTVESAGTWAKEGLRSPEPVLQAARQSGLDLTDHRSRPVSANLMLEFSLIVVMEAGQAEALKFEFPGIADRVRLLTGMAGPEYDVADPAAMDVPECLQLTGELEALLDRGFEQILRLAGRQVA
jgi:protein-tyrosine-phosphatase